MNQTVIPIGNSYGIIIPKQLMSQVGIKPGSVLTVQKDPNGNTLLLSQNGKIKSSITPDFLRVLDNVNNQYGEAFKNLARK